MKTPTVAAFVFKTKTCSGRIAKTTVFMPQEDIVVINRRILAHVDEVKEGWYKGSFPIYCYKDFVLVEAEISFWVDSFRMVQEAFSALI